MLENLYKKLLEEYYNELEHEEPIEINGTYEDSFKNAFNYLKIFNPSSLLNSQGEVQIPNCTFDLAEANMDVLSINCNVPYECGVLDNSFTITAFMKDDCTQLAAVFLVMEEEHCYELHIW